MSSFSPHWLSLREPLDHAARNSEIASYVAAHFEKRDQITIADIAGGTGSTLRAMTGQFKRPCHWHLIDYDQALLDHAKQTFSSDIVTTQLVDLSANLGQIFQTKPDLITTSAFLDLVSEKWLQELAFQLAEHKMPFYAALTYDGKKSVLPSHSFDEEVKKLFDKHQKTDKGFGTAMGPSSAEKAISILKKAGFEVQFRSSDWVAGGEHQEFQLELLSGWHSAALELAPDKKIELDDWLQFRMAEIKAGSSQLTVGHLDFFAVPG